MNYKVIGKGKVTHYHVDPGWISRMLKGLKKDAVIQCGCGEYLRWTLGNGGYYWETLGWHDREKLGLNEVNV